MAHRLIEQKLEDTLEDGAWKDSFDKILEPKPMLKKRYVRTSYNMDSSVENESNHYDSFLRHCLANKKVYTTPPLRQSKSSTKTIKSPFKCSISPVGILRYKQASVIENTNAKYAPMGLTGTPIQQGLDVVFEDSVPSIVREDSNDSMLLMEFLKKKLKRQVCFDVENSSICEVVPSKIEQVVEVEKRPTSLTLHPGKWRKSLNLWRRTNQLPRSNRCSLFYARNSERITKSIGSDSLVPVEQNSAQISLLSETKDWCKGVLKYCKQNEPLLFSSLYDEQNVQYCRKIGEGAFGEVFINSRTPKKFSINDIVYKIIPIEGDLEVNGEPQKKFETIFPEIVISTELSNLALAKKHSTQNFVKIHKVNCVKGRYPAHLISLWEKFDKEKDSENDHPGSFEDQQLFIVLELAYSGVDMESFAFQNSEQGFYALMQIILALAVAEEAFEFEHRDLHWGNILILHTKQKEMTAQLHKKSISVPTKGIKVTIIDYTLSRMTFTDGCLYNDLSSDEELFNAIGDYQFDIYRMMRDELKNNWKLFEPKTNIFWISYIISKLLNGVTYTSTRTKTHLKYMRELQDLEENILTFKSASECARFLFKFYD